MTTPTRQPRRGFKSKSPQHSPISDRNRPWGFVTRHQISGWRFMVRRISNGVALRDTRMLTDPLRRQGRALSVGLMLGVVLIAGAFILSVLRPAGASGNRPSRRRVCGWTWRQCSAGHDADVAGAGGRARRGDG